MVVRLAAWEFRKDFTEASHRFHMDFNALFYSCLIKNMEVTTMLLGLEWYWWIVIVAVLVVSIPFKVKFMKWWSKRQQEQRNQRGKWGDDE